MQRLLSLWITPREQLLLPGEEISARYFLACGWVLAIAAALVLGMTRFSSAMFTLGVGLAVYLPFLLYARFGSFRIGKYFLIAGTMAVVILTALVSHSYQADQLLIMISLSLFLQANFTVHLRAALWIGAFQAFSLVLIVLFGSADALETKLLLTIATCVIGGIIIMYRYMVQDFRDLSSSDNAEQHMWLDMSEPHATTLRYRVRVQPEGLFVVDRIYGAAEALLGITSVQCVAQNGWERWVAARDIDLYRRHWAQTLTQNHHLIDYRIERADLSVQWLRDQATVQHEKGQTWIYGTVENITEQMLVETALQSHIVQQAVIADLGLRALSYSSFQQLVDHATTLIVTVLEIHSSEIFRYLPNTRQIQLIASSGPCTRTETLLSLDDSTLPFGRALQGHEVTVMNHVDKTLPYADNVFFKRYSIRHCVMTIIQGDEQPLGVLCIYSTDTLFDNNEVYFLQSLGNIITTFANQERIRAHEREQQKIADAMRAVIGMLVTELDLQTVLDRILESLNTIIPNHDAASLMLIPYGETMLEVVSQRGYGESLNALKELRIHPHAAAKYDSLVRDGYVIINDVPGDKDWVYYSVFTWMQSYIGAPIIINEQLVGLINLDSRQKNAFTPPQGQVLKAFADEAALAIRNAQRATDLERLVNERTDTLQAEREQLQAILDSTGEGIYYAEQGRIRYANQALFDLTGYARNDLIGQPPRLLQPAPDDSDYAFISREILREMLRNRIWRGEAQIQRKDKSTFQAAMTISGLDEFARPSSVLRSVTVVRDISRQKELEQQQRRFISNAAHELRTPITNLKTRLYLLEKTPDKMSDHTDMLKRIVSRMNRLITDMLDMAYVEHGQMAIQKQITILQDLLEETVLLLQPEAEAKSIVLTLHAADQPTNLLADAHRLQQVFTNLIANAIHYTPSGGEIRVNQRVMGDEALIEVADTGNGIAPEHLTSIFEPFFRVDTQQTGTGLGLAISQDIVRRHSGTLSVISALGQGSTFTVRLPLGL